MALALNLDDVGVVHDAFNERGRAGGTRKDRMPFGEGKIGGEHEALFLVATADDLERLSKARNPSSSLTKSPTLA
jgi:hypothetical protein